MARPSSMHGENCYLGEPGEPLFTASSCNRFKMLAAQ